MRRLSQIMEEDNAPIAGCSPDNVCNYNGTPYQATSNKYTPVENILTNIKNYFCATYGMLAEKGPDNTIIIKSSRWINLRRCQEDLYQLNVGGTNLSSYIYNQGLQGLKLLKDGYYIMAIFYPLDIKGEFLQTLSKTPDIRNNQTNTDLYEEYEIIDSYNTKNVSEGKFDDDEMEDETPKQIRELITSDNKVKSVEQFAELMNQQMDLPDNFYWKAVKDKDGNESLALRHKTEKRRPFGKKAEVVDSIINIYGEGDEAIWVDGYDDIDNVPDDIKTLIENILKILGAEKTDDVCVYSLKPLGKSDDENADDDQDENNEDNDKDENPDIYKENPDEQKYDDDKK